MKHREHTVDSEVQFLGRERSRNYFSEKSSWRCLKTWWQMAIINGKESLLLRIHSRFAQQRVFFPIVDCYIDTWARERERERERESRMMMHQTYYNIFWGIDIHFLAILVWKEGWGLDPQPYGHMTITGRSCHSLGCCLLRNVVGGLLALCVPSQADANVWRVQKRCQKCAQVIFCQ